jgi:hypothetical protein
MKHNQTSFGGYPDQNTPLTNNLAFNIFSMKSQIVGGIIVRLPHVCKKCGKVLAEDGSNFHTHWGGNGKKYYRFLCRPCWNKHSRYGKPRWGKTETGYERRNQTIKNRRHNNEERFVISDCRRWDKRHGFSCVLDLDYVRTLISTGCQYCGATRDDLHIGLDRIDNAQGHLKGNVIPCCTRCNLVRGGMPYKAWLIIADAMRKARELGLFAEWVPGNKRKFTTDSSGGLSKL